MTREEAMQQLVKCKTGDTEADHCNADEVVYEFLKTLGFDDVAKAYAKVEKWYA